MLATPYAAIVKPAPVLPTFLQNMPLKNFLQLSGKEISVVIGKNLSVEQRITFGILRFSMKKALEKKPNIKVGEYFDSKKKMKTWLKIVLIILGVFLLGILIFAMALGRSQWG